MQLGGIKSSHCVAQLPTNLESSSLKVASLFSSLPFCPASASSWILGLHAHTTTSSLQQPCNFPFICVQWSAVYKLVIECVCVCGFMYDVCVFSCHGMMWRSEDNLENLFSFATFTWVLRIQVRSPGFHCKCLYLLSHLSGSWHCLIRKGGRKGKLTSMNTMAHET